MQSVMSNIFNLIENFVDNINKEYCLIIGAKYYNSNMNNAHTILPTDIVGCPTKVIWPTMHSFQKRKQFLYGFCVGCHWPADPGISS